jgi:hypothetical protein
MGTLSVVVAETDPDDGTTDTESVTVPGGTKIEEVEVRFTYNERLAPASRVLSTWLGFGAEERLLDQPRPVSRAESEIVAMTVSWTFPVFSM